MVINIAYEVCGNNIVYLTLLILLVLAFDVVFSQQVVYVKMELNHYIQCLCRKSA